MCLFKPDHIPIISYETRAKIVTHFVNWFSLKYDCLNDLKTEEIRQLFFILIFNQVYYLLPKLDTQKKKTVPTKERISKLTNVLIDPGCFGLDNIIGMLEDEKELESKIGEIGNKKSQNVNLG